MSEIDVRGLIARLDALLRNELATQYPLMADLVREARDALAARKCPLTGEDRCRYDDPPRTDAFGYLYPGPLRWPLP